MTIVGVVMPTTMMLMEMRSVSLNPNVAQFVLFFVNMVMSLMKMDVQHVLVILVLLEFLKSNVLLNLVHYKPLIALKRQHVWMIIVAGVMLTIMMKMEMKSVRPRS